mmetsp:Transcript_122685/g.281268  ORF Transcript_122685/g.281268 Transcript_122685/m.281268 type:complete len:779 (+) Transcript_122685:3-2339(+)
MIGGVCTLPCLGQDSFLSPPHVAPRDALQSRGGPSRRRHGAFRPKPELSTFGRSPRTRQTRFLSLDPAQHGVASDTRSLRTGWSDVGVSALAPEPHSDNTAAVLAAQAVTLFWECPDNKRIARQSGGRQLLRSLELAALRLSQTRIQDLLQAVLVLRQGVHGMLTSDNSRALSAFRAATRRAKCSLLEVPTAQERLLATKIMMVSSVFVAEVDCAGGVRSFDNAAFASTREELRFLWKDMVTSPSFCQLIDLEIGSGAAAAKFIDSGDCFSAGGFQLQRNRELRDAGVSRFLESANAHRRTPGEDRVHLLLEVRVLSLWCERWVALCGGKPLDLTVGLNTWNGVHTLSTQQFLTMSKSSDAFCGHTDGVRCVALCGDLLASGGAAGTVRLWSLDGVPHGVLTGHSAAVASVAGQFGRLASGGDDGFVRVWDISSLRCVAVLRHGAPVQCLLFAGDALYSGGSGGAIRVWQGPEWGLAATLRGRFSGVRALLSHKNSVLFGGSDGVIRQMENGTTDVVATFTGHTREVLALVASGDYMFSAAGDSTIRVWSLERQLLLRTVFEHAQGVVCLQVQGHHLYTGSDTGWLRVWNCVSSEILVSHLAHENGVGCMVLCGDSLITGSSDKTLRCWGGVRLPQNLLDEQDAFECWVVPLPDPVVPVKKKKSRKGSSPSRRAGKSHSRRKSNAAPAHLSASVTPQHPRGAGDKFPNDALEGSGKARDAAKLPGLVGAGMAWGEAISTMNGDAVEASPGHVSLSSTPSPCWIVPDGPRHDCFQPSPK